MRQIAMVEIEEAGLGPYPAALGEDGAPRFNLPTVRRICRDSRSWMNHDVPGEGEYARLVEEDRMVLEFYRAANGPLEGQEDPVWACMPGSDGRFPVPVGAGWPWEVVTGSRGQVWQCCVSSIGPVCAHQAEPADDDQECARCQDRVYTLSSRFWCDGCEEQDEQAVVAP